MRGSGPRMPPGLVMSWMLDRRLSFLFMELSRMKYFCACDATCNACQQPRWQQLSRQRSSGTDECAALLVADYCNLSSSE